ncbi:GAF domain-containing protein [Faecalicoccus pleomorphus]|uniref:GAF domain-containing protein n=1 Tax=Faecalicoccus pleomorphus TaxID=1323 RepID=A0A380LJL9_9FIRM|nr:GAF domain-containing protein [Faecalicoccus pleomorphus]SUO04094.1 GAF domain-containing protein [Faecalicoccus pleomorphus]
MNTLIYKQCKSLIDLEIPSISSISNLIALVYHELPHLNWVGLYLVQQDKATCTLGPFQGKVACTTIPVGKGVVGTCAQQQKMIVVDDVHSFAGHIACDSTSQSEIVVPIYNGNTLFAILDVDSDIKNRFRIEEISFFQFFADQISSLVSKENQSIYLKTEVVNP